jgi:hypothetical protein
MRCRSRRRARSCASSPARSSFACDSNVRDENAQRGGIDRSADVLTKTQRRPSTRVRRWPQRGRMRSRSSCITANDVTSRRQQHQRIVHLRPPSKPNTGNSGRTRYSAIRKAPSDCCGEKVLRAYAANASTITERPIAREHAGEQPGHRKAMCRNKSAKIASARRKRRPCARSLR